MRELGSLAVFALVNFLFMPLMRAQNDFLRYARADEDESLDLLALLALLVQKKRE